jgi:ABC-type molybdate transport system substrate-binding protein
MHHGYRVVLLLIGLTAPCLDARADEARGLVTIGMQRVFEDVISRFKPPSGRMLDVQFASSPEIAERVKSGDAVDFVIASAAVA